MDTLEFVQRLVVDLEAGQRAEDYVWSVIAAAAIDDVSDEWLGPTASEQFLLEMAGR